MTDGIKGNVVFHHNALHAVQSYASLFGVVNGRIFQVRTVSPSEHMPVPRVASHHTGLAHAVELNTICMGEIGWIIFVPIPHINKISAFALVSLCHLLCMVL